MAATRFVRRTHKFSPPIRSSLVAPIPIRGLMLPARAVHARNQTLLEEMRAQADGYEEVTQSEHKELYEGQEAILVPGHGDTMERPYAVVDRRASSKMRDVYVVGGGVSSIGELADIAAEARANPREYEGDRPDVNLAWQRQVEFDEYIRKKAATGATTYGAQQTDR